MHDTQFMKETLQDSAHAYKDGRMDAARSWRFVVRRVLP